MADANFGDFGAPPLTRARARYDDSLSQAAAQAPQPLGRAGGGALRRYPGHPAELPTAEIPGAARGLSLRGQKIVNIAGGLGSVALVLGLAWWGYDLAMRDLRGVPVVRALEGPMRIAPDDPGGEVVEHQGLAVNDVAAEGGAAPPPDRLILAPKPVDLSLEDAPGLAGVPAAPEGSIAPAAMTTTLGDPVESPAPIAEAPAVEAPTVEAAVDAALAEALGLSEAAPDAPVEAAALDAEGNPPPEGAIIRSPRPMARPAKDAVTATAAAVTVAKPEVIDAATLAAGTRLVQFGAFDSTEEAEAEWMRLAGRFPELMAGKAMVIQAAESGGKTFYRLRGHGFESEDDARRFCSALVTEGANCIPVAHR
jgi:hypothetical protein